MDIDDIRQTESIREKLLTLTAKMLLDAPQYKDIKILYDALKGFAAACGDDCPDELDNGLLKLNDWLKSNGDNSESKHKVSAEHTRLFFTGKYSIGSTASYYLSQQHTNKGAQWDDVLEFYYKNKYVPLNGVTFDEDSAGVEILFLSILAGKGFADIAEAGVNIRLQIEFYEKHINIWFDLFCNELREAAGAGSFFESFAQILNGYRKADLDILNELSAII